MKDTYTINRVEGKFNPKNLLILAPILWASAVVVSKGVLEVLDPLALIAVRFSAAFLILAVITGKRWKKINVEYIWKGAIIGTFLFLTYATQILTLDITTPGTTGFLTSIYCIMVPFLYWLVDKKRPNKYNIIGSILAVIGIGFISLTGNITGGLGTVLGIMVAFFFACTIISVGKLIKDNDVLLITTVQFGFVALFGIIATTFTSEMPKSIPAETIFQILFLVIFSSVLAFLIQNLTQRYTNPSTAGIIFSLEGPFAVIISIIVGLDDPNSRMIIGFVLIFIAIICSETKFEFLRKSHKR